MYTQKYITVPPECRHSSTIIQKLVITLNQILLTPRKKKITVKTFLK